MMIEGETMANEEKKVASGKAKECDIEEAQTFFAESSKDEGRHVKMLKGMLERYFKKKYFFLNKLSNIFTSPQ